MVSTQLGHIQFNVQPGNLSFYRDLMAFLGWATIYEAEGALGVMAMMGESVRADTPGASLWFIGYTKDGAANDYDGAGMNHLAFSAATTADVDTVVTYLNEQGVAPLFETPRHRPEFAGSDDQTYYQVMFETPDRLLIEVVYIGPK